MRRVRPRLPRRTVRLRLTLLYGVLFFAAGAGLLAVTYLLVQYSTGAVLLRRSDGTTTVTQLSDPHDLTRINSVGAQQRAADLHHLLVNSSIALGIMAAVALALGWFIAGHVLRPLRAITDTTRRISSRNLHQRLALSGPADELKDLAETIDQLLDRLEGAFTAQRNFVANASHELRTPLTYDRTLLEVTLADPHATTATLRTACEEILASQVHQERLIDALLTLASSERGLDDHEPFDLGALAGTIVATRYDGATDAGIQFEARLHPAPAVGDPRLIERLVTNLVDNATTHNTKGGWIEVSTGTRAGRAFLAVANSGPVIPAEQIDRLLQPFQRLDTARTSHPDGHGLGLSIVAAIATAHQAGLTARPNPGGGLDVEVTFPPAPGGRHSAELVPVMSDATPSHIDGD
jgi:signal transduction histidine kinase